MRITRCDSCGAETNGHNYVPAGSWIIVEADEDADHGQLCSWICLAAWATKRAVEREGATFGVSAGDES